MAEDDRYTLIHRQRTGEIRSTGSVTTSGSRLILDGQIVAPDMLAGAPVRHIVWPIHAGLAGAGDTFFLGHRVHTGLLLAPR